MARGDVGQPQVAEFFAGVGLVGMPRSKKGAKSYSRTIMPRSSGRCTPPISTPPITSSPTFAILTLQTYRPLTSPRRRFRAPTFLSALDKRWPERGSPLGRRHPACGANHVSR